MAVFHFDGRKWSEVDIGTKQVIVPSKSRLTRAVATPRNGPVWGPDKGDVWIRKEIIEPAARPLADRTRDAYKQTRTAISANGRRV